MSEVRDVKAAYIQALLTEYRGYKLSGDPRAEDVAESLRYWGHEVQPPVERAVPEPLETTVEKPRRGRPKKVDDALETREG